MRASERGVRFQWSRTKNQRTAKGASGKGPRQKTSKIVKKCQKVFRHFSTFFAQGKKRQNRQKVSKIFSTLFDIFRAAPIFRPLLGASEKRWATQRPLRDPVFPDTLSEGDNPRAPTLGPQIAGTFQKFKGV